MPTARSRSRDARSRGLEQFDEVLYDRVGTVLAQRIWVANTVNADHVSEVSRASGLHPSERVLVHRRAGRLGPDSPRPFEERVGRRLAGQLLLARDVPVDD